MEERNWSNVKKGSQTRKCSRLQKARKSIKEFFLRPFRENQPYGHLDFSPVKQILDSDSPKHKEVDLFYFKPVNLW